MTAEDTDWDIMLDIAEKQQQEYYELLPEWTKYKKREYKYLKQNIGFALYGPPQESKASNNPETTNFTVKNNMLIGDVNIIDTFCYKPEAESILTAMYEKICKYGEGSVEKDSIYYGIIYNVTFRTRKKPVTKKDTRAQNKYLTASTSTESSKGGTPEIDIHLTPVFKIKISETKIIQEKAIVFYKTWYIDIHRRVYKSWIDYKKNNTLPPCTMVLPKDGFYQPNPQYEITEESSKVWLEILDSPASSTTSGILRCVDTVSNVVCAAGLGLGIAAMFTPMAPAAVSAIAISGGVNGLWTAGRSAQHLVDKSQHEESLTDRSAFCSWLAITGSVVGVAASTGATILTKSAQSGSSVSRAATVAYNSVLVSSVGINGIGVAYQAFCMYKKYRAGEKIHAIDVLSLGTHILFFGNTVINFQFAGELIKSTQGKILDDYRTSIRSKRLRKGFNRAKRTAAENNTDQVSQNAEVIQYINRKNSQLLKVNHGNVVTPNYISFESGKIMFNGRKLLDPLIFVEILLSQRHTEEPFRENRSSSSNGNDHTDMFCKLKNILLDWLFNYNSQRHNECTDTFDIDEFDDTFHDMKYMNNAPDILWHLLEMAIALMKRSEVDFQDLSKAIHFLWSYAKENLRRMCLNLSSSIEDSTIQRKLVAIIIALFDEQDEIISRLSPAFSKYVTEYLRRLFS